MRIVLLLSIFGLTLPALAQAPLPIIDVHMHAMGAGDQGPPPLGMCTPMDPMPYWDPGEPYGATFMKILKEPPCDDPVWSPETEEELLQQNIEVMERLNIFGVLSGTPERVVRWVAASPDRFYSGLGFNVGSSDITPEMMTTLHADGRLDVLAEVTNQYTGIAPDDPRMEPYWALAEELNIPVGIHIGTGPPGVAYLGSAGYRARLHSALTLEEVLISHPRLRVYIMHAGFPMLDDLLAVLYAHPQVYVDIGVIVYTQPRDAFYRYLRGITDAGFSHRVMFGSDQMVWPGVIERSIRIVEEAPFLSEQEKRDIFYNNAARFLRLSDEEIARHHNMPFDHSENAAALDLVD